MSIRPVYKLILLLASLAVAPVASSARGFAEARFELVPGKPATVRVEGRFESGSAGAPRAFSFVTAHAGVGGLNERISGLKVFGASGEMAFRRGLSGSVFADEDILGFSYTVDLSPQGDPTLGAHVSWFAGESGVLMLLDLLPETGRKARVGSLEIAVPKGISVISLQKLDAGGEYVEVPVAEAVFLISGAARSLEVNSNVARTRIAIESEWQFPDAFVAESAEKLLGRYSDIFGSVPFGEVQIMLLRIPDDEIRDRWRAETRGANVLILSSPSTYENLGEQVMHEQLRHELLHLWIPNSLNLTGDYSWFYEGFIFYRALVAGAEERRITFGDVLNTLSELKRRANTGNWKPLAGKASDDVPRRTLHAKGALAAFAADVALSAEGRKLDDLLRSVIKEAPGAGPPTEADAFILSVMSRDPALRRLVSRSVSGSDAPDWSATLAGAGLAEDASRKIVPAGRLTSRQRTFLRRLGYNVSR